MDTSGSFEILCQRIQEMLWIDWDPIGINEYSIARDEYDSYAEGIATLILNGSGYQTIYDYLWCLETEQIGLQGNVPKTQEFSRKLFEIQEEFHNK